MLPLIMMLVSVAWAAEKYALDAPLEGPTSDYTPRLIELAKHPEKAGAFFSGAKDLPVELRAFETAGSEFYIGIGQALHIDAPVAAVVKVLTDIDHYEELFPGYEDVKVESKDGNKWQTDWEQIVPVFFLKNIHYKVWYLINEKPSVTTIRYQLKESERLKKTDGLILLEPENGGTRYREFDFWDADYGMLKSLAPGKIWPSSVEGIGVSDIAVKLKAEHPDWSNEKARDEAKKAFKDYPVEKVVKEKKPF